MNWTWYVNDDDSFYGVSDLGYSAVVRRSTEFPEFYLGKLLTPSRRPLSCGLLFSPSDFLFELEDHALLYHRLYDQEPRKKRERLDGPSVASTIVGRLATTVLTFIVRSFALVQNATSSTHQNSAKRRFAASNTANLSHR